MRYHELFSGLRVPISGEEREILTKVGKQGIPEDSLTDEREHEIARRMYLRGLLDKKRDKAGKMVYQQNTIELWDKAEEYRQAHKTYKPDWSMAIVLLKAELNKVVLNQCT